MNTPERKELGTTPESIALFDDMSEAQFRVFKWQRDVAGQPVANIPNVIDLTFAAKQIGYIKSEWFDEFIPHASEHFINESLRLQPGSGDSSITTAVAIADDLCDTVFTLLGLGNALGFTVNPDIGNSPEVAIQSSIIKSVSEALQDLTVDDPDLQVKVSHATRLCFSLALWAGFDFVVAFEEVCRSNNTKLWTLAEIESLPVDHSYSVTKSVTGDPADGGRHFRVKDSNQKLIKSPSFSRPNLIPAFQI